MHVLKDLQVWQKAMDFAEKIYTQTADFPNTEKFNLISQINRCAVSIPSNISEGAGRESKKEFNHFLSIASGSSYELETQLLLSKRIGYIKNETCDKLIKELSEIQKMIYGLKKSLKNEKKLSTQY